MSKINEATYSTGAAHKRLVRFAMAWSMALAVLAAALGVTPRAAFASTASNTVFVNARELSLGQSVTGTFDYNADGKFESYYYKFKTCGVPGTYRVVVDSLSGREYKTIVTDEFNNRYSNLYTSTRNYYGKSDYDFYKYVYVCMERYSAKRYDQYRLSIVFLPSASNFSVSGVKNKVYTGDYLTQNVKVTYQGKTLRQNVDYTVSYRNNKYVGQATVIIEGTGSYSGQVSKTFQITDKPAPKKANTVKASGKTVTLKAKSLKKAKASVSRGKAMRVSGAKGTLSYSKVSGSSKIKVNAWTGKLTIKKGTKKGTYTIRVRVKASGNGSYKAGSSVATIKVKVK